MVDDVTKKLHFHIGPDRVFENLFEQVFEPISDEVNFSYISSDDYRNHLRAVVDGGLYNDMPSALEYLCSKSDVIAISRPRLLFDGMPMNMKGGGGFYKLDTIQKGCPGYKIVFHLFLTDHLGYLLRSKSHMTSAKSDELSWLPLVRSVSEQIAMGNELCVWNVEGKNFVQDFVSTTVGLTGRGFDNLVTQILREEKVPSPEAEERFAEKVGLDAFVLDEAFEREIQTLTSS